MAVTQSHYRFGINELAESTHGWHAAEDANPAFGAIPVNTTFLLRFTLQSTGVAQNNTDPEFQYRKNGGTWTQITTSTSNVKAVTPSCWADAANTTQRLSGTGTFIGATGCTVDGIAGGASFDIPASGNGETECALQLVGADLVPGDFLEFRLTRDGAVLIDTYSVTPALGIPLAPAVTPSESFRFLDALVGAAVGVALSVGISGNGLFGDTFRLSDQVSAALDPPSNLSVQVASEQVRVRDWVFGAARNTQVDDAAGLLEPPLHLAEQGPFVLLNPPIEASVSDSLKVADEPPVGAILSNDLSRAITNDTLKVAGGGFAELIEFAEQLKIADQVIAAFGAADLSRAVADDTLKVADSVVNRFLDPLQVGPSDSLKVADIVLGPTLDPEQISISDSLKVADVVTAGLDSMSANLADSLKVADVLVGPTLDPEQASLTDSLKVSDTVTAAVAGGGDLTTSLSDSLKVSGSGFAELIDYADSLKVSDSVTAQKAGDLVVAVASDVFLVSDVGQVELSHDDTLRIADVLTVAIDPELASLSDSLKVADQVTAALVGDLSRAVADDSLKVADSLSATLDPLQAAPSDSLKVADLVVNRTLDPEQASIADSLKVADAVLGPTLDPEQTVLSDSLKVADQVTALLDAMAVSLTDSLKVADSLTASLNPEQTSLSDALKVSDEIFASVGAGASLTDSLKVADAVSATLDPEQASVSDSLKVADSIAVSVDLSASFTDGLKVADVLTVESLGLSALLTDSLKVADQAFVSMGNTLFVSISDGLKVSDTVVAQLTPLLGTPLDDGLKVADALSASITPELATLVDSLKVSDQIVALLGGFPANLLVAEYVVVPAQDRWFVVEVPSRVFVVEGA